MSILLVFLVQTFQVMAIPRVQFFVTVRKIGSLSAKLFVIY